MLQTKRYKGVLMLDSKIQVSSIALILRFQHSYYERDGLRYLCLLVLDDYLYTCSNLVIAFWRQQALLIWGMQYGSKIPVWIFITILSHYSMKISFISSTNNLLWYPFINLFSYNASKMLYLCRLSFLGFSWFFNFSCQSFHVFSHARTCEICGSTAQNVVVSDEAELIEQSNEADTTRAPHTQATETQGFWQGHRFLNFLLACVVFAFVVSWLFHFNIPGWLDMLLVTNIMVKNLYF